MIIVSSMKKYIKITVANAKGIFCITKNIGDHAKLRISWIIKNTNGIFFSLVIPPFKKRRKDSVIIMYKMPQTGGKIQSGGFKKGLFKLSYQSELYIVLLWGVIYFLTLYIWLI